MEEKFNQVNVFVSANPHYGYLLAAVVLLVLSIGHFANLKWMISPADTQQGIGLEIIGEGFRLNMGIIFLIGGLACQSGCYFYL